MSETPEKKDLGLEISMVTFALRGYLTPIRGYAQILKVYLEERQKMDDSSLNIKLSANVELEMTPQIAVEMIETILSNSQQIYQLQDDLRNRVTSEEQKDC